MDRKAKSRGFFSPRILYQSLELQLLRFAFVLCGSPYLGSAADCFVPRNLFSLLIRTASLTVLVLFETAIYCVHVSSCTILDILDTVQNLSKLSNLSARGDSK